MQILLILTAILELLAGLVLFLAPQKTPDLKSADNVALGMSRMYGGAALGLAFMSYMTYMHMSNSGLVHVALGTLVIFHFGVAAAAYWAYSRQGFASPAVSILHLVFGIATAYFLLA